MKELVCIVCPNGCQLRIDDSGDNIEVSGAKCKKGIDFAIKELTSPTRVVCTTVKTVFDDLPVVPVRTSKEIPKGLIMDVMKIVNRKTIDKRHPRGYSIIRNILDTGVDIITTSDMTRYNR